MTAPLRKKLTLNKPARQLNPERSKSSDRLQSEIKSLSQKVAEMIIQKPDKASTVLSEWIKGSPTSPRKKR